MMQGSIRPVLLVLRHHGLGDLITVQPALRGLRRRFPDHHIVVTCPSWLKPLAEAFGTADEFVSEVVASFAPHAGAVDPSRHQDVDAALLANVRTAVPEADVLVSLRTPGPELVAMVQALQPALLVSYRYASLPATYRYPDLDFFDHILERWRRLLSCVDVDLADDIYADPARWAARHGHTVVHIGAGSPARCWPLDRWADVVRRLEAKGHRIVLTGSKEEAPSVTQVCCAANLPSSCDRGGMTDVMELARLVAGARLVVGVDSGVSHLATAFRRPALTLFGPVPPAWWGPPAGNPQHRALWTGRTGDNYAAQPDPGLLEISVGAVLDAIDRMQLEGLCE
jgi:ADP-heptose:LPS heptosyltransferase